MKNLLLIAIAMLLFVGCEVPEDADDVAREKTSQAMEQAMQEVGMPAIRNWYEKKQAKMIYELRDQSDLVCHAYVFSQYTGLYTYLGRCMGYGLPYSVQYTNPERYEYQGATLPQPDPNGLFMPDGLSATWIVLLDEKTGKSAPVYIESEITVSQFKLPASVVSNY